MRSFFLITGNDYFHAFFQISLGDEAAACADCAQGGFVDHVGQLGAGSACGHSGDGGKIYIVTQLYFLGVNLQYGNPAVQIGKLHRHTPVETAGAQERGIQGFGTVGGGQDEDAVVAGEAVHFCKELVQCLFPFVIS